MIWFICSFMILLGILCAAFCTYRIAFYASSRRSEDIFTLPKGPQYEAQRESMLALIQEMASIPYEQVFITSFDGLRLAARYYHVQDGAPLQIQFHGYRGSAIRDFCGGNKIAREAGQNTLLVDQRAHGLSGGNTITFGIKERYDCLSWVQYACDRFGPDTPIILAGVSMGAASVLMASSLSLPQNVIAILADSPYSSPEAIIRKVCREDMKLPPWLTLPWIRLGARLFGHFRLADTSAVEAVQHTDIPILLIHGEADHFVPCAMSREIYEACSSPKLLETFPEAGHGISYMVDPEKYIATIERFLSIIV